MTIKLNSDRKLVDDIRMALMENDGYCPCAVSKNDDTKCMCKDFREQVERHIPGKCHCGLYELITEADYMKQLGY